MNNSTSTNSDTFSIACSLQGVEYLISTGFGIILFIGVVGNIAICFAYGLFKRKQKSNFDILILYLAISDLLICSLAPFLSIYWKVTCDRRWDFGVVGCKLMGFLRSTLFNTSNGILILFTMLRYRAVCRPFQGRLRNIYIHASVVFVMVISASAEVLYADALDVVVYDAHGSTACLSRSSSRNKRFYFQVSLVIIVIRDLTFLLIFTLSSVTTVKELKSRAVTIVDMENTAILPINEKKDDRSSNTNSSSTKNNNNNKRSNTKENKNSCYIKKKRSSDRSKKVIRSILILQIIFVFLVIPNDLFKFIYILSWLQQDGGFAVDKKLFMYMKIFTTLQILNSIVNVFVYAKLQKLMRRKLRHFLNYLGFRKKEKPPKVVLKKNVKWKGIL